MIVTARDEADRLPDTLAALRATFPAVPVVVADDGSRDGTDRIARGAGVEVVRCYRALGKGAAATLGARHVLEGGLQDGQVVLLCDADLGASAGRLGPLITPVRTGEADLALAAFSRAVGGGLGLAVGFARWTVRRRCGLELRAPISGQRALTGRALGLLLPFAPRFGMELGMTIDAVRAGLRLAEIEIDLEHRATGRTAAGFVHRGRQLGDFAAVYLRRR